MRIVLVGLILMSLATYAQTTVSSGSWTDGTIWSGGTAPTGAGTVTVNNTIEIDRDLAISGTYTFNSSVIDFTGGTAWKLSLTGSGDLTVAGGTTNFEGATATMTANGSKITVMNGATLIITGPTEFANGTIIDVQTGGTLIINGNLTNSIAGSGSFTIGGIVYINGNYSSSGNVDIQGSGDMITTGTITTTGMSGGVFGSPNDCSSGPCSGQNLCLGGGVNVISANQYICSGNSAAGLTGDAIASVLSYQWQSSTTSATSGFADIPSTNTQDYNPGTPAQTTWYRRKASVTGCTGTSNAVVITIIPGGSWKGTATPGNWDNTSNWCGGSIPIATTDVVIPAGVPFMPVVNLADGTCNNLTINNGASLTINASRTLSVNGNVTNNGTITTSGTLSFDGGSAQAVSGSGLNSYAALKINNASGVTYSNSPVNVTSTLTMTQGTVNLSGFFLTLGTSAAAPGTLSYSAGWLYGGSLTRYMSTTAFNIGDVKGLFPLGLSTTNYRPLNFGADGATISSGGYLRVSHTGTVATSTAVSVTDGASTILKRSDSFWTVVNNSIAASAGSFRLMAGGTGFGTVADINHLRLMLSASVVGSAGTNSGSTTDFLVERTTLTGANLSNIFYIGSTNLASPLPINLSDFYASLGKEGVSLNWTTLTEENSDFFQVEKSINGIDFSAIAKITAHGNSLSRIDYYFLDQDVNFNKAYYRLKNVDVGGAFTYSKLVSVEKQGFANTGITVYPNPVENRLVNVLVGDGSPVEGIISLCDLSGKALSKDQRNNVQGEYQISNEVSAGFYLLRVQTLNAHQTVKLIIQ